MIASGTDTNPFRYCGEYYDTETGLYYLRARYYDPTIGRFTQEDTHWNTANMIYGDNPQKINEREDALGLKTYSYAPQILSILQAGNLYVYCVGNPLLYTDSSGNRCELGALPSYKSVLADGGAGGTATGGGGLLSFWILEKLFSEIGAIFRPSQNKIVAISYSDYQKSEEGTKIYVKSKTQTKNNYQYWEASWVKGSVIVGDGLSFFEASLRVATGLSIMCATQDGARWLLIVNGYWNHVGPEIHGSDGFYWHYHPNRTSHTHLWFYE